MILTSMTLVIFCLLFPSIAYVPVKGEIIWYLSLNNNKKKIKKKEGKPDSAPGPQKQHPCIPQHSTIFPTPESLPTNEATTTFSHLEYDNNQCLEQPMAKVTDPQTGHLVRHRGLAVVLCLVVQLKCSPFCFLVL